MLHTIGVLAGMGHPIGMTKALGQAQRVHRLRMVVVEVAGNQADVDQPDQALGRDDADPRGRGRELHEPFQA